MYKKNKIGMAGIVTVVLIMGLLMTIATTYIKMMNTENSVKVFTDQHERALDAAFCGISYAMAYVQSTKSIFKGNKTPKNWPYIMAPSKNTYYGITFNKKPSNWNYMDSTMMIIDDEEISNIKPPYKFRVVTYPIIKTSPKPETISENDLDSSTYMVKSQGQYMVYEGDINDGGEVVATYTAQYLAELKIDKASKRVYLRRYKVVPYQSDKEFYKYLSKLK